MTGVSPGLPQVAQLGVDLCPGDAELLAAARLRAAHLQPYLATGLFAMEPVASPRLGTMAVDRFWRLYVDPETFHRWGVELLAGVLLHEVAHLVRGHADRATSLGVGPANHHRWNIAADCAINDDLVSDGIDLPDRGLQPEDFDLHAHQSVETYFFALGDPDAGATRRGTGVDRSGGTTTDSIGGARSSIDCGSGCDGTARSWDLAQDVAPSVDRVTAEVLRRRIAASINTYRGIVPAGWRRWADVTTHPPHDWKRELRSVVNRAARTRADLAGHATWTRPSRRQDAYGEIIMPTRRIPTPTIAVIIDTSASIDDVALGQAVTELRGILAAGPGPHWLICADAEVQSVAKIRNIGDIALNGGGGTDLRVPLEALSGLRPRPHVTVVLTDGDTPWPDRPPRGITTIVATTDRPAPKRFRTVSLAA